MSLTSIFPLSPIPRNRSLVPYFAQVVKPNSYALILLDNRDTEPSFKRGILGAILHKSSLQSAMAMFDLERYGRATVGVFTFEAAETKMLEIGGRARAAGSLMGAVLEKT